MAGFDTWIGKNDVWRHHEPLVKIVTVDLSLVNIWKLVRKDCKKKTDESRQITPIPKPEWSGHFGGFPYLPETIWVAS